MGIYRENSGTLDFIICGADMHHIFHANAFDVCPYLCHQLVGTISFVHVSSRDAPSIRESTIASLVLDYFGNVIAYA